MTGLKNVRSHILDAADGVSYTYNSEDDRVTMTDQSGTVTSFVLDGASHFKNVLLRSPSGSSPTYYVYGLGLAYEVKDGIARFYHFDRRGSTVLMTSEDDSQVDIRYSPFGQVTYVNNSANVDDPTDPKTPFLFNGQYGVQTDPNGLYYMRARYYSPQLRRFLNQDVVLGSIGLATTLNRFAYANGDPVSMIDPFGLAASKDGKGFGHHFGLFAESFNETVTDLSFGLTRQVAAVIPGGQEWIDEGGIRSGVDTSSFSYNYGQVSGFVISEVGPSKWVPSPTVLKVGGKASNNAPSFKTWNQFQAGTKGQFASRAEAGQAWQAYKQANGITTGAVRSQAQKSAFLKDAAASGNYPKWMNQWLQKGKVPPGYHVDHIKPISIGGDDLPSNMRLLDIDMHKTHHQFYRPWE